MGKTEDMRAMKQARREEQQRSAGTGSTPAARAGVHVDPAGELCGHRSIGNRSCTRAKGHGEVSHRYDSP
jgi:hypothetical protein